MDAERLRMPAGMVMTLLGPRLMLQSLLFTSNVRSKARPWRTTVKVRDGCGALIGRVKIDVFCHIMPRSYADRLASPGTARRRNLRCAAPA